MTTQLKPQPPCPECEKLASVSDKSNQIGDFLEWLETDMHMELVIRDEYNLISPSPFRGDWGKSQLLAKYFGIDLDAVETERRALLDWLREAQGGN